MMKPLQKVVATALSGILCIGLLCGFTPIQTEEEALQAANQEGILSDLSSYNEFAPIKDTLKKYDVFLSGEGHAVKMNFTLKKYLLQYFVKNQDVKYLLDEMGYAVGELLNEFLESGDTALLGEIVDAFQGSLAYNQDMYDFYLWLYKYNQSRPANKRIKIVAIDVEHQRDLSAKFLQKLVLNHAERHPSARIADLLEPLKSTKNQGETTYSQEYCEKLAESVELFPRDYQAYFQKDFPRFQLMAKNLLASTEDFTLRESAIIDNFNQLYESLPSGKYFGQVGSMHMAKTQIQYAEDAPMIDSFAQSLNTKTPGLENKIYSIRFLYNNCKFRNFDGKLYDVSNISIPSFHGEQASAVFYTKENSPALYQFIAGENPQDQAHLGDAFYLVNNSPAVTKRR